MTYYTRYEIAQHASQDDYWIIMGNKVYAFVNWQHPGGWISHSPFAGGKIDAQNAYNLKHGGSAYYDSEMEKYFIGYVKEYDPQEKSSFNEIDGDRFPQRYDSGWPLNVLGYGPSNPWIPPLEEPITLLGLVDRHMVTTTTGGPVFYFFMHTFWILLFNTYNGDSLDGYWYNNAETVGQQLYPQGIYKYFDMSSWNGFFKFTTFWVWIYFTNILVPLTLYIPIDIWLAIFSGVSLDGIDTVLLYYVPWAYGLNTMIGRILDVKTEDGFSML